MFKYFMGKIKIFASYKKDGILSPKKKRCFNSQYSFDRSFVAIINGILALHAQQKQL